MATEDVSNISSASTTWEYRKVKVRKPPAGPSSAAPKAPHPRSRGRRDERTPLPMTIKYRGGPEAWYEIRSRGAVLRVPGHRMLHDVMVELNGKGY